MTTTPHWLRGVLPLLAVALWSSCASQDAQRTRDDLLQSVQPSTPTAVADGGDDVPHGHPQALQAAFPLPSLLPVFAGRPLPLGCPQPSERDCKAEFDVPKDFESYLLAHIAAQHTHSDVPTTVEPDVTTGWTRVQQLTVRLLQAIELRDRLTFDAAIRRQRLSAHVAALGAVRQLTSFAPQSEPTHTAPHTAHTVSAPPSAWPRLPLPGTARLPFVRVHGVVDEAAILIAPRGARVWHQGRALVPDAWRLGPYRMWALPTAGDVDVVFDVRRTSTSATLFVVDNDLEPVHLRASRSIRSLPPQASPLVRANPPSPLEDEADLHRQLLHELLEVGIEHDVADLSLQALTAAPDDPTTQQLVWHLSARPRRWPAGVAARVRSHLRHHWQTTDRFPVERLLEEAEDVRNAAMAEQLTSLLHLHPSRRDLRAARLVLALALERWDWVVVDVARLRGQPLPPETAQLVQTGLHHLGDASSAAAWMASLSDYTFDTADLDGDRRRQERTHALRGGSARRGEPLAQLSADALVRQVQEQAPTRVPDDTGHAVFLLFRDVVGVDTNRLQHLQGFAVQLLTRTGVEAFGELSSAWDEQLLLAEARLPDGRVVEAERNDAGDLSFVQLQEGSIVRIVRRLPVDDAHLRLTVRQALPTLVREVDIVPLDDMPNAWVDVEPPASQGPAAPAPRELTDPFALRRVHLDAVVDEPFAPVDERDLSHITVWQAAPVASDSAAPPPHSEAWRRRLLQHINARGGTPDDLRKVYDFIVGSIVDKASPSGARDVLTRGRGARSALLQALLATMEVDALLHAVVVPSRPFSSVVDEAPALTVFEIPANVWQGRLSPTYLCVDDGSIFFGAIPRRLRTAVWPAALAELDDDVFQDHSLRMQLRLRPAADSGALEGTLSAEVPAIDADAVRDAVDGAGSAALGAAVRALLAQSHPGLDVGDVQVQQLARRGTSLLLHAPVVLFAPAGAEATLQMSVSPGVAVGMLPAWSDMVALPQRTRPLLTPGHSMVLDVEVELPPQASVLQSPSSWSAHVPPFDVQQIVELNDNTFRLLRVSRLTPSVLSVDESRRLHLRHQALLAQRAATLVWSTATSSP